MLTVVRVEAASPSYTEVDRREERLAAHPHSLLATHVPRHIHTHTKHAEASLNTSSRAGVRWLTLDYRSCRLWQI